MLPKRIRTCLAQRPKLFKIFYYVHRITDSQVLQAKVVLRGQILKNRTHVIMIHRGSYWTAVQGSLMAEVSARVAASSRAVQALTIT